MDRLQKVIANSGVTSRRKAEELITQGRVKVNNVVVKELGTKVNESDLIEVDSKLLNQEKKVYILLNKPRNTLTTVSDDRGRPTVIELIKDVKERIYPVGRLDFDTTGVLILTNDGNLTNLLTHPKHLVQKTYLATVKGIIDEDDIKKLSKGVSIDGTLIVPNKVELIKANAEKDTTIVRVIVHEGKNHLIKNLFEEIGYEVLKLNRQAIGEITTIGLFQGQYRNLTPQEVKYLLSLGGGQYGKKKK
ncbi:MAG: rRNA pseudouridine synthase [Bacillales bacterium]|jgi:23S rRNA pseudouridine2605 synthase|nr:rRNA pseudouridine synthase [Bacillales bacterium]